MKFSIAATKRRLEQLEAERNILIARQNTNEELLSWLKFYYDCMKIYAKPETAFQFYEMMGEFDRIRIFCVNFWMQDMRIFEQPPLIH